jgi:hypothetical protein
MEKLVKFNKVEITISREMLENTCYTSQNIKYLEPIIMDEEEMEDTFDSIVELFYNLLAEEGRLE